MSTTGSGRRKVVRTSGIMFGTEDDKPQSQQESQGYDGGGISTDEVGCGLMRERNGAGRRCHIRVRNPPSRKGGGGGRRLNGGNKRRKGKGGKERG